MFAFKMYLEFGWRVYKKIGADSKFRSRSGNNLLYSNVSLSSILSYVVETGYVFQFCLSSTVFGYNKPIGLRICRHMHHSRYVANV
jgi:hypothetical protein